MATLQERIDAIDEKLEEGANAIRHGDKAVNYDMDALRQERARLAAEINAASSTPRSTRTLLELEDV